MKLVEGHAAIGAGCRSADGEQGGKPPVFVLVHGTFARGAAWTQEGSTLRKALHARYGEVACFREFLWSGENSHKERVQAGDELRIFLQNLGSEVADRPLFIVAHSHGGNVALYALRDVQIAERVSGIVTMGTPFLDCRRRGLKYQLLVISAATSFVLAVSTIAVYLAGLAIFPGLDLPTWSQILFGLAFFLGVPPLAGLVAYRQYPCRGFLALFRALKRRQFEAWRDVRLPSGSRPPIFRAAVGGDEAGLALKLSWLTGDLPHRAWTWLFRCLVGLIAYEMALSAVSLVAYCTIPAAVKFGWLSETKLIDTMGPYFMTFVILPALASAGLALILSLLQVPMMALPLLARRKIYGPESLYHAWLLDIRPTLDPPGFASAPKFYHVERAFPALNHSRIYEHAAFFEDMVAWLDVPTAPQEPLKPAAFRSNLLARLYRNNRINNAKMARDIREEKLRAKKA
jgi:hypothetical protein